MRGLWRFHSKHWRLMVLWMVYSTNQALTLSTYQYRMLSSFNLLKSVYFIGELSCIKMIWCTSFCRTILHLISHLVYLPISLYVVQSSGFFGDYDELVGISDVWKKGQNHLLTNFVKTRLDFCLLLLKSADPGKQHHSS